MSGWNVCAFLVRLDGKCPEASMSCQARRAVMWGNLVLGNQAAFRYACMRVCIYACRGK